MPFDSVAASQRASSLEVEHYQMETEAENSRWSRLEFKRRIAERNVKTLLATLDGESQPEAKELLAILISVGGIYIDGLERQKDGTQAHDATELNQVRSHAAWSLETMRIVYPVTASSYDPASSPTTWKQAAIQLMHRAIDFFGEQSK